MTNDAVTQLKHCHNNHCSNRDICIHASEWRPEKPIFFGDERDCTDFVKKPILEQKNSENSHE